MKSELDFISRSPEDTKFMNSFPGSGEEEPKKRPPPVHEHKRWQEVELNEMKFTNEK